jgi:hypothetical protein
MTSNKYFNLFKNKPEQDLMDDLMNEVIEIHGMNCIYISRSGPVDLFYGEDPLAKFDRWYEMVAYIKSADGFNGRAMLQKWGITMEQSITIQIGKTEFTKQVGDDLGTVNRPREGDLIYFPYGLPGQYLLEIKYVNDNIPFIELGRDYIYEIDCRMFTYGNESIKTGLPEIDAIEQEIKQRLEVEVGVGEGDFLPGEVVFQGNSFASSTFKAVVNKIEGSTISLINVNGNIKDNLELIGNTSGTARLLGTEKEEILNDNSAQNSLIQTEAAPVVIKNSRNPFHKGKL